MGSSGCPPEPPRSPQKICPSGSQTPASITARGYLPCLSLWNCTICSPGELKESPRLVPFQAIHTTGNQTNSHEPGKQQPSPFCFLPLSKSCHLSVLVLSSEKAFGIYWYIYSPWQNTLGQIFQQCLIPFS